MSTFILKPEDRAEPEPGSLLRDWEVETLIRALLNSRPEGVTEQELTGFIRWANSARLDAVLLEGLLRGDWLPIGWNPDDGPTVGLPGGRWQQ